MKRNSLDVPNSRFTKGGQTVLNKNMLGWWERRIFTPHISDVSFELDMKYNKRPDLLAYDIYGTPALMWLVLQYNNILDINTEFVTGKTITLPTPTRVYTEIL